jgi:hypothetical protein
METYGYIQALEVLTTKYKSLASKKGNKVINNLKVMSNVLLQKHLKNHISIRDLNEFDGIPSDVIT